MLQLHSYFEGHGGAITSLTKGDSEQSFYSAGSEGLIVCWNLAKPNEGEVVIKLHGFIATIKYEVASNTLYVAVNHKGLFIIDTKSRVILETVEIPATSFGKIKVTKNHIFLSTQIGELLLIDKKTFIIKERIESGLKNPPTFSTEKDKVYYSTNQGINQLDINTKMKKSLNFSWKSSCLKIYDERLLIASSKGLYVWNTSKSKVETESLWKDDVEIKEICINSTELGFLTLSKFNVITTFKIEKKKIIRLDATQIEHNGGINDILWIENYKFVITAGINKKIGVWQVN